MEFKVCGITSIEQAEAISSQGAHFIGFIFYPSSKRYALSNLSLEDIAGFKPTNAKKVGVFVNETTEKLIDIATKAGLDMIQLHGDEDASYCAIIQAAFPVIKVFRVSKTIPDFALFDNVASYYLFDTDSVFYVRQKSYHLPIGEFFIKKVVFFVEYYLCARVALYAVSLGGS
jgi:phosphoribosylanthranilate isomerase